MYLLDSNTCIQFLNGRSASIERRLMGTKPSEIKLCSVVKAELWYGAARSNDVAAVMSKLTAFFAPYESLPFDDAAAVEYGSIRGPLARAFSVTMERTRRSISVFGAESYMAELEPWYRVAVPRDEVRQGRSFNPDEFAIHLA